jgi:hypothetical protein
MNDNRSSEEDAVLLCLESVHKNDTYMDQLQPIVVDVYERVEYVSSIDSEDVFTFVWFCFGWNHPIPILHDLDHVRCVYLSELTASKYMPKVYGVFSSPKQLLQQS